MIVLVQEAVEGRCGSLGCKHFDLHLGVRIVVAAEALHSLAEAAAVDSLLHILVVRDSADNHHHIAEEGEFRSRREAEERPVLAEDIRHTEELGEEGSRLRTHSAEEVGRNLRLVRRCTLGLGSRTCRMTVGARKSVRPRVCGGDGDEVGVRQI